MKEESAKNFGATNSRYLTENVRCIYTDTELYFKSDLAPRLKPNYYKIQMNEKIECKDFVKNVGIFIFASFIHF